MPGIEEGFSSMFSRHSREAMGQQAEREITAIGDMLEFPTENTRASAEAIFAMESFARAFPALDARGEAHYTRRDGAQQAANIHMWGGEGNLILAADTNTPGKHTHYESKRAEGVWWDKSTGTAITVEPKDNVVTVYTFDDRPGPDGQAFRRMRNEVHVRTGNEDGHPVARQVVPRWGQWEEAVTTPDLKDSGTYGAILNDGEREPVLYTFRWESEPLP